MSLNPLHSPEKKVLKAIALMSGSGTNLRRVLEHEKKLEKERGASPFKICGIFTDNCLSQAAEIGKDFDLPVITRDIKAFYKSRGLPRRDMSIRGDFDRETVRLLEPFEADMAIYAGYMSITTEILMNAFLGVNVHPGDLSVMEGNKRKWTGLSPVKDAIKGGEKIIKSTTHIVEPVVDAGQILMISPSVEIIVPPEADLTDKKTLNTVTDQNQERLKVEGDWVILPKTIEYIADGRFALDEENKLYFDGKPIPHGIAL